MPQLAPRPWLPAICATRIEAVASRTADTAPSEIAALVETLARDSRRIHEADCFNLNPATNLMNPRAEALLASGLGTRPSLGYPGDKYETGLEAIEEIEVICAELAAQVFGARYVELRLASGAMANLYAFMALAKPGDTIIAPPASIGGHVTHHGAGCAGLYGLRIVEAPVQADGYTVDLDALRALAEQVRPRILTLGGSLNLLPHPVAEVRAIADAVGAHLVFDAAHQCGMIAGKAWPDPLAEGAHVMTMSTYKSLGGPPAGLLLTNDAAIAERVEAIAFPGLTANFDMAKTAALAVCLADWLACGAEYARAMIDTAQALAAALSAEGLPVFRTAQGATRSHQFALEAARWGGGQAAAQRLRPHGFLACGIGLPIAAVAGDMNGLRLGTPEIARIGMTAADMPRLAALIAEALSDQPRNSLAAEVAEWRQAFTGVHFTA